jgi:hypothetical protein
MRIPSTTACLVAGVLGPAAAAPLAAQSAPRPPPAAPDVPAALAAVREADLRRDVTEMASPAMRGREGGTLDEMRASMWVAEQYRRIGLTPMGDDGSWFQWFDMIRTRVSTTASRASVGGQAMTLFRDLIPLNVVPAEAAGAVLWVPDAADTTADVRGRIVATPLLAPPAGGIRANSYTFASRYADAAVTATLARFQRRGPAAVILVASARRGQRVRGRGVGAHARRVRRGPRRAARGRRLGARGAAARARRAGRRRPSSCARRCARRSRGSRRPSSPSGSSGSRRRR